MSDKPLLNQSTWRRAGAVTIVLAALMAVYGVVGGVLRDSVIHMARIFSDQVGEESTADSSFLFCSIYWIFFVLLILSSLYMAILDVRFIRLQFALEKHALMKQSLGNATLMHKLRQEETLDEDGKMPGGPRESAPTKGSGET